MLDIVHDRKTAKNLVVFIHGLSGDRDTWMNTSGKAFPEMLLEDAVIKSKFSIAYFDYFSSMLPSSVTVQEVKNKAKGFFAFAKKKIQVNLDIKRVSRLLLTELEARATRFNNIYIVAHSMGGLVAKHLVVSNIGNETVSKVRLIISLAVPHNGAGLATLGSFIYPLLQIKDLDPLSTVINEVTQGWIDNQANNPKIIYYQGSYDTVVKEASSKGYDVNKQETRYCEETHTSISKPEALDSIVYITVRDTLREAVKQQRLEQSLEEEKPDLSELENEDFVIKLIIADVNSRIITNSQKMFYEAELARKAFGKLGLKKEMDELYKSISQIYHNAYANVVSGKISDGNALVAYVQDKITEEDERLLKSLSKIKFTHKIGMIHQLANLDDEIWWARNHSTADIEEYKRKKMGGAL
jgi:hypothetical protein